MKTSIRHSLSLLTLLWLFSSLIACSSNPIQSSAAEATDLKSLARKQQEHDKLLKRHDELLQEWSELKPGLTRLLAIEEELNLLLGQLAQLSTSLEESTASNEGNVNNAPAPSVAHYSPTPSAQPVQEVLATAEIPEPISPETISIETISTETNVRNTDYYRLKIGSFATRQDANRKCNDLKAAGMNCLVVDYTSSNFDQITN